jgi:hypothetical protein
LISRSGVTSVADADDAVASTLLASNAMRIELLRVVMKFLPMALSSKVLPSGKSLHHTRVEVRSPQHRPQRARLTRVAHRRRATPRRHRVPARRLDIVVFAGHRHPHRHPHRDLGALFCPLTR